MKQVLDFIVTRLRVIFFFLWMYSLVELLQNQRYLSFLRPEFGWVLAAALIMFLALTIADIARPTGDRLHWYEFQRPFILLVPLLFLLNAQGASLDYYTFSKRFTGTAGMSVNVEPSAPADKVAPAKGRVPPAGRPTSPGSLDRKVSSSINPAPEVRVAPTAEDKGDAVPESDGSGDADQPEVNAADEPSPEVPVGRDVTIVELYEAPRLYEGKEISVTGMTDSNEDVTRQFGDRARVLYRFMISCCAADAQPIAMVFETGVKISLQAQGVWVRVKGTYTLEKKDCRTIPVLRNASMSTIPKPRDEYLY